MSNQVALRYAVIRYMPYLETREFATVGVVAACPKTGYFDYKLTPRYSRLSHFFREFDVRIYRAAMRYFSEELEEIKKITLQQDVSPESLRTLFDQITRDREAIVCTSTPRVRLVANEALGLDYLFDHYVNHSFLTNESAQEILTKRVVDLVRGLPLRKPFKERRIGGDVFHATFPLVQADSQGITEKIIQPLSLIQSDPNRMYERAYSWVGRVKRLKQTQQMPESTAVLFAYEKPQSMTDPQIEAFQMLKALIDESDIKHTEAKDEKNIMEFAKEGF